MKAKSSLNKGKKETQMKGSRETTKLRREPIPSRWDQHRECAVLLSVGEANEARKNPLGDAVWATAFERTEPWRKTVIHSTSSL